MSHQSYCAWRGLDGYYKQVNRAFETLLGYTEEESLGKPFMEFIHLDDRPLHKLT